MSDVIRRKDMKWLLEVGASFSNMYDGLRVDLLPRGPAQRLYNQGLIRTTVPHNPVHKERWILTEKGWDFVNSLETTP